MVVEAFLLKGKVFTETSSSAKELFDKSRFGTLEKGGKLQLSLIETLYLLDCGKINIFDFRNNEIDFESFLLKAINREKDFFTRYCVFKDLRDRGYVVKTALKFGAHFRVYDRGIKPGDKNKHARWVVFPVSEADKTTWYDFASKNRVAHSTKKKLLIGVVDDENDVSYWESRWLKP